MTREEEGERRRRRVVVEVALRKVTGSDRDACAVILGSVAFRIECRGRSSVQHLASNLCWRWRWHLHGLEVDTWLQT